MNDESLVSAVGNSTNPLQDECNREPAMMLEEHYGIAALAKQWGYSEATVRGWFLERPRLGVLVHQMGKRGKRRYISVRVSKSAATSVYTEKCRIEPPECVQVQK